MTFHEREVVTVVVDLAHFTHAVAGMDAVGIAGVLEQVNDQLSQAVTDRGGRVVKYLGDGCLAAFPADCAVDAVDAVIDMASRVRRLAVELAVDLEVGANVHLCRVAEGQFGPEGLYDLVGAGVMHTFRMGGGAGVRISEPVYRKLPSDRRAGWSKQQPPATYSAVLR